MEKAFADSSHPDEIHKLVTGKSEDSENQAIQKFEHYLGHLENIGPFDLSVWHEEWRSSIRRLGEVIRDPGRYLNAISQKKLNGPSAGNEALEFIRSSIEINHLPPAEGRIRVEQLAREYPFNPEFRFMLARTLAEEGNYTESLNELKNALKSDPENDLFRETRINTEMKYLDSLIDSGNYESARDHVQALSSEPGFGNMKGAGSRLADYSRRIKDYSFMGNKIKELEAGFREKMHSELDHERRRLIELFGFFAAIVAFLLSTVSIGENFSFAEALYFLIALGLILILFVTAIFTLASPDRKVLVRDLKFWILVSGLVILFLLIINADSISKILEQLLRKS